MPDSACRFVRLVVEKIVTVVESVKPDSFFHVLRQFPLTVQPHVHWATVLGLFFSLPLCNICGGDSSFRGGGWEHRNSTRVVRPTLISNVHGST